MIPFVVKKTKQEYFNILYELVFLFTIGCFIGVVYETIYCLFQFGEFQSRKGLIYGPFNPVYGVGVVVLTECLKNKKSIVSLFLSGCLLGGFIEYLCSWFQETFLGSLSWDYSHYFLNFDGRTSLFHMLGWGMMATLFILYAYPWLLKLLDAIPKTKRCPLTMILILFFLFDISVSVYANIRQQERRAGIEATSVIQKFFDKHYPDSLLQKIYPKKKIVKKAP